MKTTIQAGHTLETATPDEVRELITAALAAQTRHVAACEPEYRIVRIPAMTVPADSATAVCIDHDPIGPPAGETWHIRRISTWGDPVALHLGDSDPSSYLATLGGTHDLHTWHMGTVVLTPSSHLVLHNASYAAKRLALNIGIASVPLARS